MANKKMEIGINILAMSLVSACKLLVKCNDCPAGYFGNDKCLDIDQDCTIDNNKALCWSKYLMLEAEKERNKESTDKKPWDERGWPPDDERLGSIG